MGNRALDVNGYVGKGQNVDNHASLLEICRGWVNLQHLRRTKAHMGGILELLGYLIEKAPHEILQDDLWLSLL